MLHAVKCKLLLYVDDICLIFQHTDINEIEILLTLNAENVALRKIGARRAEGLATLLGKRCTHNCRAALLERKVALT